MYWNKVKRINRELNCYYSVSLFFFFFILSWSHFINLDQEGSLFFYRLFALSSNSIVQLVSRQRRRYAGRLCCRLLQICRVFAGWTVISAARRRCFLVLCHAVLTWLHMQIQYGWYCFRLTVALKHLFFLKIYLNVTSRARKILFLQGLCKCKSSKISSDSFGINGVTERLDLLQICFMYLHYPKCFQQCSKP